MGRNELVTWLQEVSQGVGEGPVTMVNLLRFRPAPLYAAEFDGKKQDVRSAYYEGYAGAFQAIAADHSVHAQLVYAGSRQASFEARPGDDWDDLVMVRYERLGDLIAIVQDPRYLREAEPHRLAAVADWRFSATRAL